MARKKQYISQLFKRDKDGMTALSRTGIARIEALKAHCNLTDGRIKNWLRDGYAKKVLYKEDKEVKEAIILTKPGKDLLEKQWGIRNHYHAQTQSPYHDLALSEKYFLLSEQVRETWRTETDIREQFLVTIQRLPPEKRELYQKMLDEKMISMPDCAYTSEGGVEVAFEVITGSYGKQEMLAKETTVEIMNFHYETTRI